MKPSSYMSIQKKLMFLVAFSIIVPSFIFCLFSYSSIKGIVRKNYETQTFNTLNAGARSVESKIAIADTAIRQIHFNSELIEFLSADGRSLTPSMQIEGSRKLFNFMEEIFLSFPDASQIRMDCFNLRKNMLMTNNLYSYEKEHIYVRSERTVTAPPYQTYITPTHLQHDYTFSSQASDQYRLVYSDSIMIYQIPSVTEPIGRLSVDIPIDSLGNICKPLISGTESIQIADDTGRIIYSSDKLRIMEALPDGLLQDITEKAGSSYNNPVSYDSGSVIFCVPVRLNGSSWYLIKTSPIQYIYSGVQDTFSKTVLGLALCCVFMLLFSLVTILKFTTPLKQLTAYTDAVQKGSLTAHLSHYVIYTKQDEIGSLIKSIQKMMYTINHFTIWQYQLELSNRTIELKALQAQINPHFIYNTLQCIATQALEDSNITLYNSITKLGQMMHYSMDTVTQLVPFAQELLHCTNYIQLQQLRFEDNDFTFLQKIEKDALSLSIPKMILQPLIENSFKHGQVLKRPGSFIHLSAFIKEREFYISVEDNGVGIKGDRLEEIKENLEKLRSAFCNPEKNQILDYLKNSTEAAKDFNAEDRNDIEKQLQQKKEDIHITNNIGLGNVYMRLLLNYSNQCRMTIRKNSFHGVTIEIIISMNAPQMNGGDTNEITDRR